MGGGVRWGVGWYVGGMEVHEGVRLGGGVVRWGVGGYVGRMGVREGGTSWVGGTVEGGGERWIRWGGGGGLRLGGGEGGVDLRSWSKKLFLGTLCKVTTYWPPLDEHVRSSFAESCKN